jgi:excisionase family DNA binding protein
MSANAVAESAREDWIRLGVAAERLRVTIPVVVTLIRNGKLSVRRVGSWRRVRADEVAALDEAATAPAARPPARKERHRVR